MDDILHTLKLGLSAHLEKSGSSLEEFEKSLASLNEAEGAVKVAEAMTSLASFEKQAIWAELGSGLVGAGGTVLKGLAEGGLTTAMLAGTMGGAGAYGLKKYMEGEDKEISSKEEELQRVRSLTERLKMDYGLHQKRNA